MTYVLNEVVIMEKESQKKNSNLQKKYLPSCLFMGKAAKEHLLLLEGKCPVNGTIIYVCTNRTCKMPVDNIENTLQQIENRRMKEKT